MGNSILDFLNAFVSGAGKFVTFMFNDMTLYMDLTWGWFLVGCAVVNVFVTFFIYKLK